MEAGSTRIVFPTRVTVTVTVTRTVVILKGLSYPAAWEGRINKLLSGKASDCTIGSNGGFARTGYEGKGHRRRRYRPEAAYDKQKRETKIPPAHLLLHVTYLSTTGPPVV